MGKQFAPHWTRGQDSRIAAVCPSITNSPCTGGGPQFPPSPEGQKAQWRDKRTCVLPVKLEAAHFYRVGINSKNYQNFSSSHGLAALDRKSVV